jgi:hypothetical protein
MTVRQHVLARQPLDGFPRNLILRIFMKISLEIPDFVTTELNYQALDMMASARLTVAGDTRIAVTALSSSEIFIGLFG